MDRLAFGVSSRMGVHDKGNWHRSFAARFRVWAIGLGWILAHWMFPVQEQVLAQTVPGALYQVRLSDYYGQLKNKGYTPLRFTITRFGTAVKSSESLYAGVTLSGLGYNGRREFISRIDFKEGQVSATTEVNLPSYDGYAHAVVSRDGSLSAQTRRNLIASISLPSWLSNNRWNGTSNTTTDSVGIAHYSSQSMMDTGLHMGSFFHPDWQSQPLTQNGPTVAPNWNAAVPSFKELFSATGNDSSRLFHNNMLPTTSPDPQIAAAIGNRFFVGGDFSAIPSTWAGLSRVDVCLLSAEDLSLLANQAPDKLEVIRQWVVAGGRLVILNCQANYSSLGSIIPNLTSAAKPPREFGPQQWSMLNEKKAARLNDLYQQNFRNWINDIANQNAQQSWQVTTNENPIIAWMVSQNFRNETQSFSGAATKIAEEAVAANAPFLFSDYGTGLIIAVPSDGTQLQTDDWLKILLTVYGGQQTTCFEGIGDNNHAFGGYPDFNYTRLGKPPWILFLLMISLFAVTVGPVAFVVLRRMGRTHLLLGAVPLIAAVITIGIVGYAMVQDGFAFRTSRLSVTWLDSANQSALTQTTQMVYSGLAPGSFEFPLSTAYYDDSGFDAGFNQRQRSDQARIFSTADRQTISGTRIQARTKIQVTSFDVQQSNGQLLLSASPDGAKWEVTNQLGFTLELLIVQTPRGIMVAENIADGANAVLAEGEEASSAWIQNFNRRGRETQAAVPELLESNSIRYGNTDRLSMTVSNLFDPSELPVGSFLAVSLQQPLARNLREQTFQDEEFHLTAGRYRATTPLPKSIPVLATEPSAGSENTNERSDETEQGSENGAGDNQR